jgi:hypothetical protein
VSGCPVAFEITQRCGAPSAIPSSTRANAGSAGSIMREWNACEVSMRCVGTPLPSASAQNAATSAARPDTTVIAGALIAAISSVGGSQGATSPSAAKIAAIAPGSQSCIRRARARRARARRPA